MSFLDNFLKKEIKLPVLKDYIINNLRFSLPTSKDETSYLKEYKNWVFTCVTSRAEELASIELILKNKKTDEVIDSHEVLDLLGDVNPNMTQYQLFYATQAFLDLTGNAYWYLARENDGKGAIREIYMISPDKMHLVLDKENNLRVMGYIYKNGKDKIPFDPQEILHFRTFNPIANHPTPHKGVGIVESALWAIETDNEARNWNYSFFKNSAKPDGVLSTDAKLTDDQFKTVKENWEQAYRGSDKNGKVAVLEGGLKWIDISKTQKDMDFVAQRTFSRDEILSIFRVPKTVVGITDDVNRANAEASDYVFARRTVKPLMKAFVGMINEYLLPEYGPDLKFHFKDPVPEDRNSTIQEYSLGINKWLSRNDIRRREGLTESDNGDTFYGSFGEVAQDTVTEQKQVKKPQTKEKSTIEQAVDDFIGRLPKKKTDKDLRRLTSAQKGVYKDLWLKRFDENEKALKTDVESFFSKQQEEVLKNLEEEYTGLKPKEYSLKGVEDVLFDEKQAVGASISLITPHIRRFLKEGAEMADSVTGGEFNLNSTDTLNFITERAKFYADSVNGTTKEDLLSSLKEGIDNGEGFDDLEVRVRNVYKDAQLYRVERIVRTEVSTALNKGAVEAYQQAGVNKLEWVAILDDRTSEQCQQNDGSIREIGKSYPAGATEPPQHINCRCTVVAVFED